MTKSTPQIKGNKVTFQLHAPQALMVNVLGTFNHWDLTAGVMEKSPDGTWKRTLVVPFEGSYDYKFIVNGEWIIDPLNHDYGKDEKGRYNSRFQITTSAAAVDHLRSISAGLEAHPPGGARAEREKYFALADRMLQLPTAPHSRILRDHFDERLRLLAEKMKNKAAKFVGGAYCHGYVLQTAGKSVGIDVVSTRSVWGLYWDIPPQTVEALAEGLDALFVSHLHPDHQDPLLIKLLVARGVPVFVPSEVVDRFPEGVIPMAPDATVEWQGWKIASNKGVHVYDERRMLVLRYFEFLSPDGFRLVHTTDHDYTTGVKKSGPVDCLIAKAGGVSPVVESKLAFENLLLHLQPKKFVPGHLNELGHGIGGGREPYRTGWEIVHLASGASGDVLHWGETWPL